MWRRIVLVVIVGCSAGRAVKHPPPSGIPAPTVLEVEHLSRSIAKEIAYLQRLAEDAREARNPVRLACLYELRDRAIETQEAAMGQGAGAMAEALTRVSHLTKDSQGC